MKEIITPITSEKLQELEAGEMLLLSGEIFCGRDAVLPRILNDMNDDIVNMLSGSVIFHTAVSKAGVGPTSSNKLEIEESMIPLSKIGVKMHLGKGQISKSTVDGLGDNDSIYAVIAPVTALLEQKTISKEVVAYGELGMEAFYKLKVDKYPIIIAAIHGRSIYE